MGFSNRLELRVAAFRVIAAIGLAMGVAGARAQVPGTPPPLPSYRARILGVFNAETGEPIQGAEVIDVFSHTSALTTKTGTVALSFLPDGGSIARIQKIGFEPVTKLIAISPSDTVPITLALDPIAQTLPTVVTKDSAPHYVSPGLQAFEERRRSGIGHFITEAELRKNDNSTMTNVLRRLPGINFICPRTGPSRGACWAISGRQANKLAILGGSCDVDVYINGVISNDHNLESFQVNQFAGVEYYTGGAKIPVQYNKTGSSCGVLLFWTRER